jgi:hypothetical protein
VSGCLVIIKNGSPEKIIDKEEFVAYSLHVLRKKSETKKSQYEKPGLPHEKSLKINLIR